MDIIIDSQYIGTAFSHSSLAINSSWESDPEYIHQTHLPYRDIVQEDEKCPWHWNIRAKGFSSVDAMMNGPIYFLNKPLGNTIRKKIPQKNLSDLLFSRKTCCINYTHVQNPTSCLTGIDKWKDLQLQYFKRNLLLSFTISIIWAQMPLQKSSKENSFDTGETSSRCIE